MNQERIIDETCHVLSDFSYLVYFTEDQNYRLCPKSFRVSRQMDKS